MKQFEELKDDSQFLNLHLPNGGRQRSNTKQVSRNKRPEKLDKKRTEKRNSSLAIKAKEDNSSRRNSHIQQAPDT